MYRRKSAVVKFIRKRRLFDDDADWLPVKGRTFTMKQPSVNTYLDPDPKPEPKPEPKPPQVKAQRPITDAEGLDRAYSDSSNLYLDSQGTVHVAGTKGNCFQKEWRENYFTMGVPLVEKMIGVNSSYRIEDNERYKELDAFIKSHPGQVKNFVGRSKGAAVIDV